MGIPVYKLSNRPCLIQTSSQNAINIFWCAHLAKKKKGRKERERFGHLWVSNDQVGSIHSLFSQTPT